MMRRLFTVSETALAGVRTRTFRHVHDLSMLHQQSRAARLAGLPGHQRRRPDHPVPAVGRRDPAGQRRPARGHHRRHGGLLLAAHAGGATPRSLPAGDRDPARSSAGWPAPTAWSAQRVGALLARGRRERRGRRGDPGVRRARPHRAAGSTTRSTTHRRGPAAGAAHQRRSASPSASSRPAWRSPRWSCVGVLLGVGGDADGRRSSPRSCSW